MELFSETLPFYKGNLHMHTTCSDGILTPEAAVLLYKAHGYDFVALTDHDVIVQDTSMQDGLLVLSGIELAFELPAEELHLVGVGLNKAAQAQFDIRFGPQAAIDTIRQNGGRAIIAHPAWSLLTTNTLAGLRDVSAAEIYNALSTEPRNCHRADASMLLDSAAAHGCILPLVAVDDAHFYEGEHCNSYIMVQADALTDTAILAALDQQRFYATQGPRIHQITVTASYIDIGCSPVNRILFYSNLSWVTGRCRMGTGLTQSRYDLRKQTGERFVRCQIIDEAGKSAWTNPIVLTK